MCSHRKPSLGAGLWASWQTSELEVEDIKKRWKEYIEELYKKDLNDLDNHDGVILT